MEILIAVIGGMTTVALFFAGFYLRSIDDRLKEIQIATAQIRTQLYDHVSDHTIHQSTQNGR